MQGQPGRCNVYLIEDDGGVTLFDAGARTMTRARRERRREARRHPPGGARPRRTPTTAASRPALGVPVLCHPDEVQDAEGSGGFRYWPAGPRGAADAACASCTA